MSRTGRHLSSPRKPARARRSTISAGSCWRLIAADVFDPNCKNMDVAVDSRGRIYVADTVKLAIIVFEPATGEAGAA